MSKRSGRKIHSPRLVLGALIIKHIKYLNNRDTLAEIQENVLEQKKRFVK